VQLCHAVALALRLCHAPVRDVALGPQVCGVVAVDEGRGQVELAGCLARLRVQPQGQGRQKVLLLALARKGRGGVEDGLVDRQAEK
jgi:hypothetical protein